VPKQVLARGGMLPPSAMKRKMVAANFSIQGAPISNFAKTR
jgi:hypothetical protein